MPAQDRRYQIGEPAEHQTLSFSRPVEEKAPRFRAPARPAEAPAEIAAPPRMPEKRAVWVVHGMGQQVPFETLDALAQGIIDAIRRGAHGWEHTDPPRIVQAKFVSADDPAKTQVVQRVEIALRRPGSKETKLELHLYEAYWAPLTEGVAKITDVVSFLFDGALHGLLNCRRPFSRAMFPDDHSAVVSSPLKEGKCDQGFWNFRIPARTAAEISVAVLIVLALGAINAVILAASAAHLKFSFAGAWPAQASWDQLTAIASAISAAGLTFGAVLYLGEMSKPASLSGSAKSAVTVIGWLSVFLTAGVIILGGLVLALVWQFPLAAQFVQPLRYRAVQFLSTSAILVSLFLCAFASRRRAKLRSQGEDHRKNKLPLALFFGAFLVHMALVVLVIAVHFAKIADPATLPGWAQWLVAAMASPLWVWPTLLVFSKLVRDVMVEYPGDVAIYVSPNKLDRFNETRQKIKQLALDSLMPLYAAQDTSVAGDAAGGFLYSKVAIVGHSLGSVIAYDTLNKVLSLDELLKDQFGVAERTCILETFGSPLDKTAFFFSYQGTENFNIREQLAASVQPMIQSYDQFRKFPWINVYSRNDVVSGNLKFYDVNPPKSAVPPAQYPVKNIIDPDAVVPLIGHVQYWTNTTVWDCLLEKIT